MDVRYLLLLIFLVSCLPESQVSKGNLTSEGTSQTSGGSNGGNNTIPEAATQWNYLSTLSNSISINASNLNNSYIVGKKIEEFLNTAGNFNQDYCLVSRYSIGGLNHELRTRMVPVSYYDFTAKRTVKIFRVDFNDLTNSQSICGTLPLMILDSNGNYIPNDVTIAGSTYDPRAVCSNCSSLLHSSKLLVFKKAPFELMELPLSQVDIRTLSLSIDPNNNSGPSNGTCSQSQCAARGFDCCLDNQCITDGSIRPTAYSQYASQLQSAEQERLNNPLAYLNYPHLYYICGSSVPSTTGGSTGGGSYQQGLSQLMKDYFCVEHMRHYKTGETFHQDLLNGVSFFPDEVDTPDVPGNPSTLYPIDIECRNETDPSSNMYYKKVAERLYKNCGCAKNTLEEMVASCPAYEYQINFIEASGLPNRIDCYTPNPHNPQIPTQQTVSVNSRSAPHRFFKSCGSEFGTPGSCPSGDHQEGDTFQYQDDGNILPSQQDFGMNSILGQMTVTLDKALPAKTVDVELDQVYQISTISGFYNPCPTCDKDRWFNAFSAHPSSAYGAGLQAVGFSTQRDFFDGNTTGGNYEDTIFGRACWVPPTMLPFSHSPQSNTQAQRLNRLKTQAALYANGYQRDWYGFNKGALIGSFDGVSWFAIGKGRIVRSTSKKLFLAINAPFADLAAPTLHAVNVVAYDGISQMAQVDYDPQYHLSHSFQNNAGTCQANHFCNTDADCISRLGWEYMCANVQNVSTQWPQFDVDANEKPNLSSILTFDQVLHQKRFPSSSTNRCVYRGSGALCLQDPLAVTDMNKRKTVTCAPNFYCANVNSAAPVFNSKVSRYAANLEEIPVIRNHLFGKDANVLGRPLSYTASSLTTTLPTDVKNTLIQNMNQYVAGSTNNTGLCLPGKALPDLSNLSTMFNPYEQHKTADSLGRTDYISQVGSCNSGFFNTFRYTSCPVLNGDGNYEFLTTGFNPTNYEVRSRGQNMCGLDSLLSTSNLSAGAEALSANSPFRYIEGKLLNSTTIFEPSLARDACLRRAGQVCHTDLDCGPNKMHADQVDNFSLAYFGNEAEKSYYKEYLVCSQEEPKPNANDINAYKNYDMSKNRCCRGVGSELTTYTSNIPLVLNPVSSTNEDSSPSNDSYDARSYRLDMWTPPGVDPRNPRRYSRLATVEGLHISGERPILSAFQDRTMTGNLASMDSYNVMTRNQWKTLNEANSESCCGGGWIRKFSDGTTDWTRRDRVYIDVKNFACINSRSVLLTTPQDVAAEYGGAGVVQSLVNQDIGDFCKDSTNTKGSCAQNNISDSLADTGPTSSNIIGPLYSGDINAVTHYKTGGINFTSQLDYYFYPKSTDSDKATIIDYDNASGRRHIKVKLPSFITKSWDNNIDAISPLGTIWTPSARVEMYEIGNESNKAACVKVSSLTLDDPATSGVGQCATSITSENPHCCYSYDSSTRVLKVVPAWNSLSFGVVVTGKKFGAKLINATPAGFAIGIPRTNPGTNSFYLRRLGRLELSGIPQITYSPIMCNDNSDRVVPGIFKHPSTTDIRAADFNNPNYSFNMTVAPSGSYLKPGRFTNHHALQNEPVFSANEFKCCTPLGKNTKDVNTCCSSYGVASPGGGYTCKLPGGTDLMVYFNRYVSNEGVGADKPGGGLEEADFDTVTGEPNLSTIVNQKIGVLGAAYCASGKVRQGGAFGQFPLQPQGPDTNLGEKLYGIVDSSADEGQLTTTGGSIPVGYSAFMAGFRWNHHLYCED